MSRGRRDARVGGGRKVGGRQVGGGGRHDARVARALGPAAVVTLMSAGTAMMPVFAVGGAVTYVLDVSKNAEGALGTIWLAGVFAVGVLLARGSWLGIATFATSVALFLANATCLILCCLWCTLQFRWIRSGHPATAAACERALFALCPPTSVAVLTWAFAPTSAGAEGAAFYGLAMSLIAHRMFLFPIESGLAVSTDGQSKQQNVLTAGDAKLSTAATLTLPVLVYVWTNFGELFGSTEHLFACGALVTIPVLYLICLGTERSLWWWRRAGDDEVKKTEMYVLLLALTGFALSLEGGIIFSEFAEYIEVQAPLSYMMITVSVHCALAVAVACYTNSVGDMVPLGAVQVALAVSTATAICAMGAPFWLLPVPVVGSRSFLRYHYEDKVATDYGIFASSCFACFAWFLSKNFWSLEISIGSIHISRLCFAIATLAVMALAVPVALSTKSVNSTSVGALIVGYIFALAVVEQILIQSTQEDDVLIYPPYLVICTSVCGILASKSLVLSGTMSRKFGWMAQSASAAKLSMMFLHGVWEMFSVLVVVLVISAPHTMLHPSRGVSMIECISYCAVLVLTLLIARFAMFDIIFEITGHRPTDATLFGGLLLVTGASLLSVTTRQGFGEDVLAKQFMMLLIFFGLFLVTFSPPLPWKGEVGMWYDAAHVPDSAEDDARLYGVRDTAQRGWPSWLLMLATLTAMFAMSSPRKQTKAVSTLRIIFGAIFGGSVGLYMALEYFVEQVELTLLLFIACSLVGVFLSFAYTPSPTSSRWLPYVYTAFVCVMAMAYMTQSGVSEGTVDEREKMSEAKFGVISVFAGTSLQIAFALKFQVQSSLKSTRQRQRRRGGSSPFLPATGRSRPEYFRSVASRNEHRELKARSLAWMPIIGNVATFTSFIACVVLSDEFTNRSVFSVFVVAPILLLLHQDSVVFPILDDNQRYAPPLALIVGKLCYEGTMTVLAGPNRVHVFTAAASKWPWVMANGLSLFLASVNSINLVHYLATSVRTSGMTLILSAPLAVVAFALSKIPAVRALAATSLVSVLAQDAMQRRSKIEGLKYL